jgi:hypothetical protein
VTSFYSVAHKTVNDARKFIKSRSIAFHSDQPNVRDSQQIEGTRHKRKSCTSTLRQTTFWQRNFNLNEAGEKKSGFHMETF